MPPHALRNKSLQYTEVPTFRTFSKTQTKSQGLNSRLKALEKKSSSLKKDISEIFLSSYLLSPKVYRIKTSILTPRTKPFNSFK